MQLLDMTKPRKWLLDDGREVIPLNTGHVVNDVRYVPVLIGNTECTVRSDRLTSTRN